jgi:hypothetical protein
MTFRSHDIGALIKGEACLNPVIVTAGAGTDGTQVNGTVIDRLGLGELYFSAKVIIPVYPNLTTGVEGTVISNAQDSATTVSTAFADFDDKDGSTVNTLTLGATDSTAAFTTVSELEYDLDISTAKRYIRIQVTPSMTSTATNTLDYAGILVFGGSDTLPAD